MADGKTPGGPGGGPKKPEQTPAAILKVLIEGYTKTANLQSDYQSLHQALPSVLDLAGEILKKKEEGAKAFDQGLEVVEKVLADASSKAEELSKAMAAQHEVLAELMANKTLLTELLKSEDVSGAAHLGAAAAGLGTGGLAGGGGKGGPNLADTQLAAQLNTVMSNIQTMIAREVAKQAEQLRTQMEGRGRPN